MREWKQQREREVQEQRQQAAAEYTASLRARLGIGCLRLLDGGSTGISESWLAFVLWWARAFVGCGVSHAQAH